MNIVLFGFKRCGKTRLGHMLASHLHRPFLDTDDLIESYFAKEQGEKADCRTIYKERGAAFFHALEKRVIASLAGTDNAVIAVGGGAIIQPDTRSVLETMGRLVYLKAGKDTLKHRLLSGDLPAFLDPSDPEGSFDKLYAHRLPLYEKIPALPIDTDHKTDEEIIEELWRVIRSA